MWNKLRYIFINKSKHKKKRREIPETMYIGPTQWLGMKRSGVMS